MKRTGFKPKTYKQAPRAEREPVVYTPIPLDQRRGTMANVSKLLTIADGAYSKHDSLRSEQYRREVAKLRCAHCGKPDRSQHAHENEQKGKGQKLDDRRAMPLCADEPLAEGCHTKFDQYRLIPGGREAHVVLGRQYAWLTRTLVRALGLWPKNLPHMPGEGPTP